MRTLKLVISYDGTGYRGWQAQSQGPTIQQELGQAIFRVTGERRLPVASGRTDAGVHALGQVAHVRTESRLSAIAFTRAVTANLPEAIRIVAATEMDPAFHARRDARRKWYRYLYHDGPVADVFLRRYCWKVRTRLDTGAMTCSARRLEGERDFRCFQSSGSARASSVRTLFSCRLNRLGDLLYLDMHANGFLYNMARAIAGSLYEVGRGKRDVGYLDQLLRSGDRARAGPTAPARGLFLVRVDY